MAHPKVGTTPIGTLAQERTPLLLSLTLTSGWGSRILYMIGARGLTRVACFSILGNGKGVGSCIL